MKKLILIIALVIVVGAVLLVFVGRNQSQAPGGGAGNLPTPTTTPGPVPAGPTISLQTNQGVVTMKNFYNEAAAVNQATVFLRIDFRDTYHYEMGYNRQNSTFYIMLDTYSLADAIEYRSVAEDDFLNLMGISKSDACKLRVDLRVNPTYVTAGNYPIDLAQMNYGLSFCPGSVGF